MDIKTLVNQHYTGLTDNERRIALFILENLALCSHLSSEELSEKCFVSRTTVLRFCRKLGLSGFAELKFLLKARPPEVKKDAFDIALACENYHGMIDAFKAQDFSAVCRLISGAETIYIYGTGNAQKAEAEEFKRIFLSAGKCVIDLFDLGEIEFAKEGFTEKDLFVIISLSGETPAGIDILKSIAPTPVDTLSITRFDNNTIACMCRTNLYVGTKTLRGNQDFSYEQAAAFYVLLDILFVSYLEYTRREAHGH